MRMPGQGLVDRFSARTCRRKQLRLAQFPRLFAALCAFSPFALAQELPGFTEEDLFADIPEVISATRLSQKLTETPAAITIIDREQINASGAINISDLFRLVPGFQSYHVTRNKMAVNYHGQGGPFPNRMEVMIDGRSIYLPLLSTVAWESIGIGLDDIERIEVVRGSNVPTQGSNAFLGSINIITRSPLNPDSNSAQVMTGNRGEERAELRHTLYNENSHLRVSAGFSQNDGSALYNDAADNRYLHLSASSTLSLQDSIDIQLGFTDGQTYVVDADETNNVADPRDHSSNFQYLVWDHAAADDHEYKLSFYHNYLKLNVDELPIEVYAQRDDGLQQFAQANNMTVAQVAALFAAQQGLDGTFIRPDSEHGTSELYDLEIQHTYYANEHLRMISGLGYRFEQSRSDMLFDSTSWISEERWRAFGNVQWDQTEKWVWNLSGMYESTSVTSGKLSPRLALNYKIDESSNYRFAYTRAYRMPSLLEANRRSNTRRNAANNFTIWDQVAVPTDNLRPESINSVELGYYNISPELNAQFDVRIFRESIKDAINTVFYQLPNGTDRDDRVLSSANAADWVTQGVEFQIRYNFSPDTWLLLNANYSNASGEYRKKEDLGEAPLILDEYMPKGTGSLLLSHETDNHWQFSIAHYVMGATRWFEGTSQEPRKAYQRTDLQIKKTVPLTRNTDAQLKVIVQNLLDDQYQEFYPNNTFDRRAYVEFKLLY